MILSCLFFQSKTSFMFSGVFSKTIRYFKIVMYSVYRKVVKRFKINLYTLNWDFFGSEFLKPNALLFVYIIYKQKRSLTWERLLSLNIKNVLLLPMELGYKNWLLASISYSTFSKDNSCTKNFLSFIPIKWLRR